MATRKLVYRLDRRLGLRTCCELAITSNTSLIWHSVWLLDLFHDAVNCFRSFIRVSFHCLRAVYSYFVSRAFDLHTSSTYQHLLLSNSNKRLHELPQSPIALAYDTSSFTEAQKYQHLLRSTRIGVEKQRSEQHGRTRSYSEVSMLHGIGVFLAISHLHLASGLTYGASTLKVFLAMSKEFREVESKNRRLTAPDHPASTPFHHHHQTSISIHRTPSKALNLPPEVRNSIYRYSLTIANPDRMYELIERPNVALLRTNKQIYGEAAQVFGMCNEFIRFSTDCLAALTGRDLPGLVFANLRRGTDLLQGEDPQVIDRLRSTNTSVKAYPRCILDVGAYITRQSGYYEGSGAAERSISAGDDVSTTNANVVTHPI